MSIRTIIFLSTGILLASSALPADDTEELATAEKFLARGRILYEESDYDSLPYYYLNARTIFHKNTRPKQAAECFLGMAEYYRLNLRIDLSEATLDSACKYIEVHLGLESESWADALYIRAKLKTDRSQYDQAIDLLGQNLNLLKKQEASQVKIARTNNILGATYYNRGDLQKAQEYYMEAYKTYQQIEDGPSMVKNNLLFNIGLLHSGLGNHNEWKKYISESIVNIKALYEPDHPDLARPYSSLSGYFIANGMSDSALFYLEKSEEIIRNSYGEDDRGLVILYIQRARIYRLVGDYDQAMEYYQQAYGILDKNENTLGHQGRSLYLNMGDLYRSLGEYELAEKELLNLLDFAGIVHPTNMATYYSYLAEIQRLLLDYTESEKYYWKVFEIYEQNLAKNDHRRVDGYLGFGILLDSLKMYEEADQYYLEALRIAENNYGFHHLMTSRILKSTGDHNYLIGEHDKALDYYQQCIFSMDPDYDVAEFANNPPPENINKHLFYLSLLKSKASVLMDLAGMAVDLGDRKLKMKAVYSSYQTSISIIDQLRNSYLSDISKLYLTENERDTYEKCIESAYHCYELFSDQEYLKQAFMVAEKAKYATLLSVLQREKTIVVSGIPDSIVQIDAGLRRELSLQQELLLEIQEDTLYDLMAIEHCQAKIFQLRARIENLNRRLEREYPGYYDLLYNQQVLAPDALRKKLRSSEKLLEYFYTKRYLYRFDLSRQGLDCHRILIGDEFNQELAVVEDYLSRNFLLDTLEVSHDMFLEAAHSLHQRLIPTKSNHSRLIIIPEGKLSYFPFDILVSEPVEQFSGLFNQVPFLIKDYTIRYGYSATLLERLEKGDPIRMDKLVAFAPGYIISSDLQASAGSFREKTIDRTSLRSLPFSINEVEEIGKLSGGRVFTGTTASEKLFKKLAVESHILHLATHAFLDDEDPLKSKLVFSEGDPEEDGFLNVYEIYNLNLAARMVVLSACNTGTGRLHRGEGIMSLARAFIYAGVPNIVMTLWTVSDRQSYELMLGFYSQLIAGRSAETALRKAKLEFLKQADPEYQHPQYWAGYIFVGNPDSLLLPPVFKWLLYSLLAITLFFMGYFLLWRKLKRKKH